MGKGAEGEERGGEERGGQEIEGEAAKEELKDGVLGASTAVLGTDAGRIGEPSAGHAGGRLVCAAGQHVDLESGEEERGTEREARTEGASGCCRGVDVRRTEWAESKGGDGNERYRGAAAREAGAEAGEGSLR